MTPFTISTADSAYCRRLVDLHEKTVEAQKTAQYMASSPYYSTENRQFAQKFISEAPRMLANSLDRIRTANCEAFIRKNQYFCAKLAN